MQRLILLLLACMRTVVNSSPRLTDNKLLYLSNATNILSSEMDALHDLYFSTNGEHWRWRSDPSAGIPWNFSNPILNNPCVDHWQGIKCSYSSTIETYYVTEVDLSFRNLHGSLPDSLSALTQLQTLYLYYNRLTGTIPESLGNFTQLQRLYLYSNQLHGPLPASLGKLSNLQYLELYSNLLSGSIPPNLTGLSLLKILDLSNNMLTASLPITLGALTQLLFLSAEDNQLTGAIPDSLGDLTVVEDIYLNSNMLSGPLPESLGNTKGLQYLSLFGNNLNGTLPSTIGNVTQLQYLALYDNILSGPLPVSLGNLTALQGMVVYNNKFTGSLPISFGSLSSLQILSLYENQLSGTIPDSVGNLTQLQQFVANNNDLTGTIPAALGKLSQLQYLVLSSNKLTGPIPDSIGNLMELLYLFLYNNSLTGSIPAEVGSLTKLHRLDLDTNALTGSIPASLFTLAGLTQLTLFANQLTSTIPVHLGLLTALTSLDLHSNRLTGSIPPSLSGLTALQYLGMDANHLTGTIPTLIRLSSRFVYLRLSDNLLSGTIPNMSFATDLEIVQLQNNFLSGSLDGLFDPTTQFQVATIVLNNNHISGTVPASIFALKLRTFSAINNCLNGLPIASICENMNMIDFIVDGLSSSKSCRNKLFISAYTLQHTVGGSIPTCLFQLPNITTLHLSGNGFIGSIPSDIVLSNTLTDLSLSHNALTGSIPEKIQHKHWNNIDLSYNRLSGTLLPNYVSNKSTELDNNRLSGAIPKSFQTLRNVSVLGSNLFSCSYDESDLPQHDPGRGKYHCGSNSFNIMYYIWMSAVVTMALVCGYFSWKYGFSQWRLGSDSFLLTTGLYDMAFLVCRVSLKCCMYVIVVLLPTYTICHTFYGTQEYLYAYEVSSVYMSGVVPLALIWCAWVVFLLLVLVWVLRPLTSKDEPAQKQYIDDSLHLSPSKESLRIFALYLLINSVVVVGVNAAYVYVAVYQNSALLFVVQTLLSVFKLFWGKWVLPHLCWRESQYLAML